MTNLLDGVSTEETAPQAAKSDPASAQCRYCSETFTGAGRLVFRGRHESKMHHDEWLKSKATGKKPTKKAVRKPTAPKAKVTPPTGKKRIKAGDGISMFVGMAAQVVTKVDGPLGRALQLSAPATGDAIDELVAGTIVDRLVIQKVAGTADKWEKVGGVIAFPILIAVISRNPALFEPLEDQLRAATVDVINGSIPSLEKKKARERKAAESLRRLGEVDERYANAEDPILLLLQDIFQPQAEPSGEAE